MSIKIFYDETKFRLNGGRKIVKLIKKIISDEKKIPGDVNFIITNDEHVRKINISFLKHDYNTDVITFDYNTGSVINGEVYLSLDTVKHNSIKYNVGLNDEITRVIIHGVLHLVGYDDKTAEERRDMKKMEDFWLDYLNM